MFIEELQKLKKSKKIASVYTDGNDTSRFAVGYIVDFSDEYFIIGAISPCGTYDGFVLKEVDTIFRINIDSIYENKIETLTKYHNNTHECINLDKDNLISSLLKFSSDRKYIVSLEILNSGVYDIQGYIQEITNDGCTIKQVTEYGEDDGTALVAFSDITKVSCNSSEESVLNILNSSRK